MRPRRLGSYPLLARAQGIEPCLSVLEADTSPQCFTRMNLDEPLGIEPKSPESKAGILPLDEGSMASLPVIETGLAVSKTAVLSSARDIIGLISLLDANSANLA